MKVVEKIGNATLYLGDCMEIMPKIAQVDVAIVDPPYGDTSLEWDVLADKWSSLVPTNNFWCWGSLRFFRSASFPGWKLAQDIVWEKHNGSGSASDRFRRVHEHCAHFYRGEWSKIFHQPVFTNDTTARAVRRKKRPPHWGDIGESVYTSMDGGPRLKRSVWYEKSCHGFAQHPTQKPIEVLAPLIEFSCPTNGTVLDPFMGSGSAGVAALKLGRKFIGIEINREYFDIACERLLKIGDSDETA